MIPKICGLTDKEKLYSTLKGECILHRIAGMGCNKCSYWYIRTLLKSGLPNGAEFVSKGKIIEVKE